MKDILLDEYLDIDFKNGDFGIEESTALHQKILILSEKGEFKEHPKRGVAARRFLEEHTPDNLAREIRQEFSADGMRVNNINISDDLKINIEAFYNES